MNDPLSARNLRKYGLRRGAYDGANRRRFVLFEDLRNGNERRHEFDSKRERDEKALRLIAVHDECTRVLEAETVGE